MLKNISKHYLLLLLIIILMIAEPSINSGLGFWLRNLLDSTKVGVSRLYILKLLTIGFIFWVGKRLLVYLSSILRYWLLCLVKLDLKDGIFAHAINLDTSRIISQDGDGKYISIFVNDVELLEQKYYYNILGLIGNVFSVIILGGSLVILNKKIALFVVGFGVLSLLVPIIFSKKMNEVSLTYSETRAKFVQSLKEYFGAYNTIKNYSIENEIKDLFHDLNKSVEKSKFNMEATMSLANNTGSLLSWFMQFVAIGSGLVLVSKGEILIGTVMAAQTFADSFAMPLQNIVGNLNGLYSIKSIVKKIEELSSNNTKFDETHDEFQYNTKVLNEPKNDDNLKDELIFDDLYLEIDGKKIIDHVSYHFEKGKKYLVIGKNGSGKSSMFKAVKHYFRVLKGKIYVKGINVCDMDNDELSRFVTYHDERVSLFTGTIKENLKLFKEISDSKINEAINVAHLDLDLERKIDDMGHQVSSGEQRKIELARSLLMHSEILVFDEVTSTLDIETAYEMEKMILELKDKTTIFISHTFSGKLIKQYDDILIIDNGRIIAHGTYDSLIHENEYFQKICDMRFGL